MRFSARSTVFSSGATRPGSLLRRRAQHRDDAHTRRPHALPESFESTEAPTPARDGRRIQLNFRSMPSVSFDYFATQRTTGSQAMHLSPTTAPLGASTGVHERLSQPLLKTLHSGCAAHCPECGESLPQSAGPRNPSTAGSSWMDDRDRQAQAPASLTLTQSGRAVQSCCNRSVVASSLDPTRDSQGGTAIGSVARDVSADAGGLGSAERPAWVSVPRQPMATVPSMKAIPVSEHIGARTPRSFDCCRLALRLMQHVWTADWLHD